MGLSGNDLLCYALIHGYSQDRQGAYFGSLSHTAEALNISRRAVVDVLERLVTRGVIKRKNVVVDGVQRCMYTAVVPDEATPPPQKSSPQRRTQFRKPTLEEVKEYCRQRGNKVDAERFVNFYETNGWVQGRGKPIRDWKAAVRTWENRDNAEHNGQNSKDRILAERQGELAREIAGIEAEYRARRAAEMDACTVPRGA